MEKVCRVFIIGDSLFTETLAHMLAGAAGVAVVGSVTSRVAAFTAVAQARPHVIIVADVGDQFQAHFGPLLSLYPNIPIISADLNRDYVQIITSRRVNARRDDLLAAIDELAKSVSD